MRSWFISFKVLFPQSSFDGSIVCVFAKKKKKKKKSGEKMSRSGPVNMLFSATVSIFSDTCMHPRVCCLYMMMWVCIPVFICLFLFLGTSFLHRRPLWSRWLLSRLGKAAKRGSAAAACLMWMSLLCVKSLPLSFSQWTHRKTRKWKKRRSSQFIINHLSPTAFFNVCRHAIFLITGFHFHFQKADREKVAFSATPA